MALATVPDPAYVICLERKTKERCDKNFPGIKALFPQAKRLAAVDASALDAGATEESWRSMQSTTCRLAWTRTPFT